MALTKIATLGGINALACFTLGSRIRVLTFGSRKVLTGGSLEEGYRFHKSCQRVEGPQHS